jgi:hypothetical protein
LAEEVETKRKDDEITKQNVNQDLGTSSTTTLSIVNIPPPEYTPLSSIPRYSSISSQTLNFEGSVVSIGDYYFDNRTRSIKKRYSKGKRGEDSKSNSCAGRILEWKVGHDLEENVVQAASVLNAFARLNDSSILEVTNALNTVRTQVTELKIELNDIRDEFDIDFQEFVRTTQSLNTSKITGSLQAQRDNMNEDLEKRMKILRDTHKKELEVEKHKISVTPKKTSTSIGTMESIKAQASIFNEYISNINIDLLGLLIDIRVE